MQSLAFKYFHGFKPHKIFSPIFSNSDRNEIKKLALNKNIVVTKPDKGRGVVILDRNVYVEKLTHIISDTSKFVQIKESIQTYSLRIEDKINNFLRKLKNMSLLSDDLFKELHVTGSGPGIL